MGDQGEGKEGIPKQINDIPDQKSALPKNLPPEEDQMEEEDEIDDSQVLYSARGAGRGADEGANMGAASGSAVGDASKESVSPHAYDETLHDIPEITGAQNLALPGLQSVQHLEKPTLINSKILPPEHSPSVKSLLPTLDSKIVDLILSPEGRGMYTKYTAMCFQFSHENTDSMTGDLNLSLEQKYPHPFYNGSSPLPPEEPPEYLQAESSQRANDSKHTASSSPLSPKQPPEYQQAASNKRANDSKHTASSKTSNTHNFGHVMDIQDGQDNQNLQGVLNPPDNGSEFSTGANLPSSEADDENLKVKGEDLSTCSARMQRFVNHPEHLRQDSSLEQAFLGCRGPDKEHWAPPEHTIRDWSLEQAYFACRGPATENWTPPEPTSDWLSPPEDTHPCSNACGATVHMESGSDMCPDCYEDFLWKTTLVECEANKPPMTASPALIQESFDIPDEPMTQLNAVETKSHQLASFYLDSLCSIAGNLETPVTHQPSPPTPIAVRDEEKKKKNRCALCRKKVKFAEILWCVCRCGNLFCPKHHLSENHDCSFDYKTHGRQEMKKKYPRVVGEKIRHL